MKRVIDLSSKHYKICISPNALLLMLDHHHGVMADGFFFGAM